MTRAALAAISGELLGCDTMVATPGATAHGQMVLAKNSDRPTEECQPLVLRERHEHPAGATLRTQFLELPQAPVTYRHVGSRPHWCWGYEHGFNEHQVAIGNEALPSRLAPFDDPKLVGMELIRLGLERGRTAAGAVDVMTGLTERYGQGAFRNDPGVRTYDNSYMVADPHEAYVLETAGHDWAVKRVAPGAAMGISNTRSLFDQWDRVSPTAETNATTQGWWPASPTLSAGAGSDRRRLDFGAAFGPVAAPDGTPPRVVLRGLRSCAVLGRIRGAIDAASMMAVLRDHADGTEAGLPLQEEIPFGRGTPSICMHYGEGPGGGVAGNTAASLVADLCADGSRWAVYWCSFYSPCLGVFFPVFLEAELPAELGIGGANASEDSPWWLFRDVERLVRADGTGEAVATVRGTWQPLQAELLKTAYDVARQARALQAAGNDAAGRALASDYVARTVQRVLATVRHLQGHLATRSAVRPPARVAVAAAG
ncbi:MAG: hypothetical protein AVDCRST_MAG77-4135 [uncultured Chloroflexi bacterium]|uniref:Dipeptidase n=1 Tax=uncultured Chloroflexota bacterium TaxID=166587 RepID=A0A6J4JPL2_9CHLR|nr:MAG: hypothetical protein AVDCRST_MAG77-4135 [uncultured Chloroflexota bacterium]